MKRPLPVCLMLALAAPNGDQACVAAMTAAFKRRHDLLVEGLDQIPGIRCLPGDGTFYVFPDVTGMIDRLGVKGDLALAEKLLNEALVALVPGSASGTPGHLRLPFATSDEVLKKSLERIAALAH